MSFDPNSVTDKTPIERAVEFALAAEEIYHNQDQYPDPNEWERGMFLTSVMSDTWAQIAQAVNFTGKSGCPIRDLMPATLDSHVS